MDEILYHLEKKTSKVERLLNNLQQAVSETESGRRNVDSVRGGSASERLKLEKRLKAFELRESEFEGKTRELAAKEEELRLRRQGFDEEVRLRELKFEEQCESVNEHTAWLEAAQLRATEKLREIESRERDIRLARDSLAARERDLVLKEEKLRIEREDFAKNVRLADHKLRERKKLLRDFMESLEIRLDAMGVSIANRFEKIEMSGNVFWDSAAASIEEAAVVWEAMDVLFNDLETIGIELMSVHEEKMRELALEEQRVSTMNEELLAHVKLRDEQLTELNQLGNQLLKRFELAENTVKDLKTGIDQRFNEIRYRENEITYNMHLAERKRVEMDSKSKALEEREKEIKIKEVHMDGEKVKFQMKCNELDLKEKNLVSWEKELDLKQRDVDAAQELNEKMSTELIWKEKNLNSVKTFVRSCFHDHLDFKRKLRIDRDSVEKHYRDVKCKEQKLEDKVRELEVKEKQIRHRNKELALEHKQLMDALNAPIKILPDDSVDIIFVMKMDGKSLQMFLNDPEKDLELMGDEIFKVLHLSSDPAKLVLDAMSGFYPPHLRKGDKELNVRKTCILLLEQLIKMKPKIQPGVEEEAFQLASGWMLKMRNPAENPLKAIGFLHLVAAYNLASYFDERFLCYLKEVAQHKETPELDD